MKILATIDWYLPKSRDATSMNDTKTKIEIYRFEFVGLNNKSKKQMSSSEEVALLELVKSLAISETETLKIDKKDPTYEVSNLR
jgi:hypothetical protein